MVLGEIANICVSLSAFSCDDDLRLLDTGFGLPTGPGKEPWMVGRCPQLKHGRSHLAVFMKA